MRKLISIFLVLSLFSGVLLSKDNTNGVAPLSKVTVTSDVWLNANRMNGVFRNNGIWLYDVVAGNWGLEWPKGSGNSPIFAGGQMIGAVVDGEVRVAGIQHSATEFQAGEVLEPGVAANPRDAQYRWYELKPGGVGDWTSWAFDQGAPYVDANENGQYDTGEKPKLIGDQTIFSVWNDLGSHTLYGTNKLSVEVRQTAFAFNRADALGDMQFVKWQMVNKSGQDWDSTYFSIWLDPDLGDAEDDLVGCDTTLGLGFTYNASNNDQSYGVAPPAQGIDFFQGPIVDEPGSTVSLPDGTVLTDKKMLKMTSFVFYNNSDDNVNGNPDNGQDVWNYQRSIWRNAQPITYGGRGTDPNAKRAHFMFPADPETEQGTGWLDSEAADRRFLMTTGPFTMKAWEDVNGNGMADFGEPGVQEIVAGIIMARGDNNLNSVTTLKEVDNLAQLAYDLDFNLASAPLPPDVTVSTSDNKAVLTWTEKSEFNEDGTPYSSVDPIVDQALGDTVIIDNVVTEITDSEYNFYGYTLYQYADASGSNPVKVESWDIGGQADAMPYTKQRFYVAEVNKNNLVGPTGAPLINGKEYYYGLVAEGYLEFGAPKILQSPPTIVTIVPRHMVGSKTYSTFNDTLSVVHTGNSDGSAVVWVVDPTQTTGQDYKVTFNADLTWNLIRGAADTLAKNVSNQTGDDAYNVYDGLMVKVMGPTPGINTNIVGPFGDYPGPSGYNGWNYEGDRYVSWGPNDYAMGTWAGSLGDAGAFFGTNITAADYKNTRIEWAGADMATEPERWSKAAVYRRDKGYAFEAMGDFPAAAYDISDPDNPRRLNICFVEMDPMPSENDPNNLINANGVWDMGWHTLPGDTGFCELGGREYFFINTTDYQPDGSVYNADNDGTYEDAMWAGWVGPRAGHPYLEGDWWMELYASQVNSVSDVFSFSAPAAETQAQSDIKADMKKIKVVPNPYYGYHSGEIDPFNRWVQFTNLPDKCTIKIFDLAGNLIQKLEKDDATTPFMQWDLKNLNELPVASGIYVFHVKADGIGEKTGKIALFTPSERLDTY